MHLLLILPALGLVTLSNILLNPMAMGFTMLLRKLLFRLLPIIT